MLAGAYSKTYKAIEQQQVEHLKLMIDNEKGDSVAKAKKLSLETNKRRKAQATKRKVEQEREEKRRQQILIRRRQEQREATERYQRSHLPSRPPTGRNSASPVRGKANKGLDETLRLIRGHSGHHHRHKSPSHHGSPNHHGSPSHHGSSNYHGNTNQSYTDALNRPYFNKYSSHHQNTPTEKTDNQIKNRLHNNSLRNLNNSKSLFEQQLEQQQRILADQQKQAINEFNDAVMREITESKANSGGGNEYRQCESESLSSVDSLENSQHLEGEYGHQNEGVMQTDYGAFSDPVIRTNVSGVIARDTHQNVRDVSAQLSNYSNVLSPTSQYDRMGQIDSFNVDQTQNIDRSQINQMEVKPDFQSTYQNGNRSNENRPKVQLRAWATPSPVDSAHVSKPQSVPMTNANPYTPRNTMTAVTMTTVYDENKFKTLQSNGWPEEKVNLQSQYSANINTNGSEASSLQNSVKNTVQNVSSTDVRTKNLEFLETVTNTMDKKENHIGKQQPVGEVVSVKPPSQSSGNSTNGTTLVSKPPSGTNYVPSPKTQSVASKLPRPVSAVNKTAANESNSSQMINSASSTTGVSNGMVISSPRSRTSSFASTVPVKQESPRMFNTYGSSTINPVNARPQNTVATTNGTLTIGDDNQRVFAAGGEKLNVRQVTQVKFAANVVNGNVHMNNFGKLQVLPDKPVLLSRQPEKENETQFVRKASDDIDLPKEKSNFNGIDSSEVKGILKRTGGMRTLKKAGSTGSVSNGLDVKDSIEIAKATLQGQQTQKEIPKKKSVRFADLQYSEDLTGEEEEQEQRQQGIYHQRVRPSSAKVISQTAKTDNRIPRVASAGTQRVIVQPKQHKSTIVRPQAAAHIITQNAAATAILSNSYSESNDKKVTFTNNDFMSKVPSTSNLKTSGMTPAVTEVTVYSVPGVRMNYTSAPRSGKSDPNTGNNGGKDNVPMSSATVPSYHNGVSSGMYNGQTGPVYDENGMRIDRTPTDDEINFLWEKVRTCLNRNSTSGPVTSEATKVTTVTSDPSAARQAAPVSHKYIDGASLSHVPPKPRVTVYNHQNISQALRNNQNSEQRTNPTAESPGVYQKRFGLLHQRKQQQNPNSLTKNGLQRQTITYHGPVYSNQEPSQNAVGIQPPPEASESMAAFLTAEHLAQQSLSDSQIHAAMEEAQRQQQIIQANRPPSQKVPSALSMEEQRLLESLDRLNEKLKITEFPGALLQEAAQTQQEPPQQPFVYGGAFKGQKPINSQRRVNEGNRGGGFRGGSATRNVNFRYP